MGKRRIMDDTPKTAESTETTLAPTATPETPVAMEERSLTDEVKQFLERRDELARKLAEEIAATEHKLAELRRTAAMLYPEKNVVDVKNERKAKKGVLKKAKPVGEASPAAVVPLAEVATPVESASSEGAS